MFTQKKLFAIIIVLFVALFVGACNLATAETPTQQTDPNLIYTAAAQTVAAQLTGAPNTKPTDKPVDLPATATQPAPAAPTATQAAPAQPTATQQAPAQPTATRTAPTATKPAPTQIPCNQMEWVKDVTIPDGTEMKPGDTFDKTWRVKNTGSCSWDSSYKIIFDHGNRLGAPDEVKLTSGTVAPGAEVNITIKEMEAPAKEGTYQGFFKARDGDGNSFGLGDEDKAFWVKIVVTNPVAYDFLEKAEDADWYNATSPINFGDKNNDDPGVAAYGTNVELEDGETYDKVLGTYPQRIDDGIVYGVFSGYKVQDGDHFKAEVGFRADCSNGRVVFTLAYYDGGHVVTLKSWKKSCGDSLLSLNYDLSDFEGSKVEFVLMVDADGSYKNDKAIWVDPRIENE